MRRIKSIIFWPFRWVRRHWKLTLVLLVIAALLGWWQWQQYLKNQPKLTFGKPVVTNLTKKLQVSGVVDATEKAKLRFAAGGKVVYLGAKEGDTVKKGQTIATIDKRELQKRLQQDLNTYMRERWDWETSQDATDYNVETLSTRRTLDKEQWNLDDTVLDVEIRDIAIQNSVLTSPFAGVLVTSPTAVTGVNVLATDAFEVVNPATLVFKALVDEADIGLVKPGQSAEVFLDAFPDSPLKTVVRSIAYKSSESSSGTVFIVELSLADVAQQVPIRLGMNGDVTINVDSRENVLAVPLDATRQRDSQVLVDVRTGERTYEERVITTDLETDDQIEVIQGLTINDEILLPEATKK